jgi:hypothetical protein
MYSKQNSLKKVHVHVYVQTKIICTIGWVYLKVKSVRSFYIMILDRCMQKTDYMMIKM